MSVIDYLKSAVSTKGRKIQVKQGLNKDFTNETLDVGEFGLILDKDELRIGLANGTTMTVNGGSAAESQLNSHKDLVATNTTLGHVKVGTNIDITSGTISVANASIGTKGVVQLNDTLTSTSTTLALTARQGKELKDLIDNISVSSGGGITIADIPDASTTSRGLMTTTQVNKLNGISSGANFVQVIDSISSTSTSQAASAYSVKRAYDLANTANNKVVTIPNITQNSVSTQNYSSAIGVSTTATGMFSFACGLGSKATGRSASAGGNATTASGDYSFAQNEDTTANVMSSSAFGRNNKTLNGDSSSFSSSSDTFVIGNGAEVYSKSNAFRVTFAGATYGQSAFNSTGADYAEYFEWLDSNPNNEDRVGYFVALNGEKIEIANSNSDYIIGVISANPSVIGDSYQDQWQGMYVTDEWGRIQNEYVDVKYDDIDEEGNKVTKTRQDYVQKLNPNYDNESEYIPREQRKEWSPVGMLGKLLVRDDGTCEVNGYAKVSAGGIATKSDSGYRVIKRVDENIVQIIFK